MPKYYANADASGNIIAFYADDVWTVDKIPTTAVLIDAVTWNDAIVNPGKYIVQNGAVVLAPPKSSAELLADAKAAKHAELMIAERNANKTFTSSALGTSHTYVRITDTDDYSSLFNAEFAWVNSALYDGNPIEWYTIEAGNVNHTKDQFNQAFVDGRSYVASNKYHRANLDAQVDACTTVDAVNAITW